MYTKIAAACAAVVLTGCATHDQIVPVKFELPVNRFELPERSSRSFQIGGAVAEGTYVVVTPDQIVAAPGSRPPEVGSCPLKDESDDFLEGLFEDDGCSGGAHLRADLQVNDTVQIGVRKTAEGVWSSQLKLFLKAPKSGAFKEGDSSWAITAALGKDARDTEAFGSDTDTETRVEHKFRDYALIGGLRLDRWVLLYGGPYFTRLDYSGTHSRTTSGSTSTSAFGGDPLMRGLNLGLNWNMGSRDNAMQLECARARVTGEGAREYVSRCGLGFTGTFGARRR